MRREVVLQRERMEELTANVVMQIGRMEELNGNLDRLMGLAVFATIVGAVRGVFRRVRL